MKYFEIFERSLAAQETPVMSKLNTLVSSVFEKDLFPTGSAVFMVQPQPAAKPEAGTHSLPHHWDQGENWKRKSEKTHGLR